MTAKQLLKITLTTVFKVPSEIAEKFVELFFAVIEAAQDPITVQLNITGLYATLLEATDPAMTIVDLMKGFEKS